MNINQCLSNKIPTFIFLAESDIELLLRQELGLHLYSKCPSIMSMYFSLPLICI